MFVDRVKLNISSGNGGAGCSSFRKEKFVPNGGPDGGDGGAGGDVVFIVSSNTDTLSWYKGKKYLKAGNGKAGMGRNKSGKRGEELELRVPPGTQIIDAETGGVLLDLTDNSERVVFLKGGKGGLGNTHFKNSRNQAPTYCQPGLKGEARELKLELKLIANVGLVGFPNVGKSTLISALSNARPEIANYEFTTLTPKLGIVNVGEYQSFVLADIPGIIEGASDGKGLGLEFLRHIERTQVLLFMIDISNYRDLKEQLEKLQLELQKYSKELPKREYAIAITKIDTVENSDIAEDFMQESSYDVSDFIKKDNGYFLNKSWEKEIKSKLPNFILPISSVTNQALSELKYALYEVVEETISKK